MSLTITGKLTHILPIQSGETARGRWVRGGFVIEYGDDYPRKASFSLFGEDKVAQLNNIAIGTFVQVRFNPESREYESRWFTDNRCISVAPLQQGAQYGNPQNLPPNTQTQPNPYGRSPQPPNVPQMPNYTPNSGYQQPQYGQQPSVQMPQGNDPDLPF